MWSSTSQRVLSWLSTITDSIILGMILAFLLHGFFLYYIYKFFSISNIPTYLVTIGHIYITLSLYRKRFVTSVVGFRFV